MSSPVLFSTLKTQSKHLAVVAREFALDLGTASFRPAAVQHLPGIANVVADSLSISRKFEPGKRYVHHQSLTPSPRPLSWWKTLTGPSMPAQPLADTGAWSKRKCPRSDP